MLKINPTKITIESEYNGFCDIIIDSENDSKWIEIHGNELDPEFPLILQNKEEIDQLCNHLKSLLD